MNYASAEDAELVVAARDGDLDAFEALVRRHQRAVYGHAYRFFGDPHAAEDAAQEVFLKVYRSLDAYDGRARFSTWLYRITRNTCLDQVRAGKRRPVPVDPLDIPTLTDDDLGDTVALSNAIETALASLPPEDRDALSAVSVFGLTYAEAADAIGVPAGTVKSRVFRARRTLAAMLELPRGGARELR